MDNINVTSWLSQPDVCRCCLSTSGSWDMTSSYITESGMKEVYVEMLQECYGLSLSRLTEWDSSRLVCAQCVAHLRDACTFKKQVLQSERLFTDYCITKESVVCVKTETETPDSHYPNNADSFDNNADIACDDERKLDNENMLDKSTVDVNSRTKTRKTKLKTKRKRKKIDPDNDIDSDTPIAALVKHHSKDDDNVPNENQPTNLSDRINNTYKGVLQTAQNSVKQVSERRRVMVTCEAVLRGTTACPFRHHKSWFQCFFCTNDYMRLAPLREHTRRAHADLDAELAALKRFPRSLQIDISDLQCRHCHTRLHDVHAMRAHFLHAHDKLIYSECIADYKVDASPYSCHLCQRQFHVFRTLTTHLNEHYANCICDVCGKSFINSKRLKVHKRTHELGDYPCAQCGKVLKTKTSKANHMESAHSKRVIKCQICSKPMKHYNDRVKHMSEAHGITHKFKCALCPREYNIKHYLATHVRQTHGHRNKKCADCGMAFITNHGLKKHMLRHSGAKPYSCALCCKAYARRHTLADHVRHHHQHPA